MLYILDVALDVIMQQDAFYKARAFYLIKSSKENWGHSHYTSFFIFPCRTF
jgi:hypothetical protein